MHIQSDRTASTVFLQEKSSRSCHRVSGRGGDREKGKKKVRQRGTINVERKGHMQHGKIGKYLKKISRYNI